MNFLKKLHPVVRLSLLFRIPGSIITTGLVAIILIERDITSYIPWLLLASQAFIWPYLACFIASRVEGAELEIKLQLFDSNLVALWVVYLGYPFPLLLVVLSGYFLNIAIMGGPKLSIINFLIFIIICIVGYFVNGGYVDTYTGWLSFVYLSIIMIIYMTQIGIMTHYNLRNLRTVRKKMKQSFREIEGLSNTIRIASSTLDLDTIMENIIKELKNLFYFEITSIQLYNEKEKTLEYHRVYSDDIAEEWKSKFEEIKIPLRGNESIFSNVFIQLKPFYNSDVKQNDEFRRVDRVIYENIFFRSVIIFPLVAQNRPLGTISFFACRDKFVLSPELIKTISSYVQNISSNISNALLFESLNNKRLELEETKRKMESFTNKISHFLSAGVYKRLCEHQDVIDIYSRRKELIVCFIVIDDLIDIAEINREENLCDSINMLLGDIYRIVEKYEGIADHLNENYLKISFEIEENQELADKALSVIEFIYCIEEMSLKVNQQLAEQGINITFKLKFGVHAGYCNVGNFGSKEYLQYNALGPSIFIAKYTANLAHPNEIYITENIFLLVNDIYYCEKINRSIKTLKSDIIVYKVVCPLDDLDASKVKEQTIIDSSIKRQERENNLKGENVVSLKDKIVKKMMSLFSLIASEPSDEENTQSKK